MSDLSQGPVTRGELRALAAELLEQMRAINSQIAQVRLRLFEEAKEIRRETREGARHKRTGRITVFHEADGSTRVERD